MFRSLIGAAIGSRLAKRYPVLGGATGALAVRAVPFVLRRISLPAMLAMGAGGYLAKRYYDGRDEGEPGTRARPTEGPDSDTGTVIDNPPGGAIEKTNGRSPAVN